MLYSSFELTRDQMYGLFHFGAQPVADCLKDISSSEKLAGAPSAHAALDLQQTES
jgi:hypothetical protein